MWPKENERFLTHHDSLLISVFSVHKLNFHPLKFQKKIHVYTHTHTHTHIYIFYSKIALVIWAVCETTDCQQVLSVKPKLLQNPKRIESSLKLEYYISADLLPPGVFNSSK